MSDHPEHEKLKKVKDKSQAIGDFLEWVATRKRVILCEQHQHVPGCYTEPSFFHDSINICGARDGEYIPFSYNTNKLLAEYFGIDLDKLEAEKQKMLNDLCGETSG